jgi:transcriptional regulator with XRE-family HTH domain
MAIRVILKAYLDKLRGEEGRKPEGERREVPTIKELAEAVGVSRTWLSQLANGRERMVNLDILGDVAEELRRRGFAVEVGDLFLLEE